MSIPGYGGQLDLVDPFIAPNNGTIRGGTEFVILNSGISLVGLCDTFPGIVLDPAKWVNTSTDAGTVSVDDSLILTVPNTPSFTSQGGVGAQEVGGFGVGDGSISLVPVYGGTASISSVATFETFDVSAYFSYDTAIEKFTPVQQITYLTIRASIDANNHFDVSHIWNPLVGSQIVVTLTENGSTTVLDTTNVKGSVRYLKLVRYNGRVLAFAGADLIHDFRGWRNDAVSLELVSETPSSVPLSTTTVVTNVIMRPVITFGEEICPLATEYAGRIVGVTPPYDVPEPVQVRAWGSTSEVDIATFTYFAPLQLSLNTKGTLVIDNDDTLRDSNDELKGLRI